MPVSRTGRPKLENPRAQGIYIRLTQEEHTAIKAYAKDHNLTITQTMIDGFLTLKKETETPK